jgi:hypothetical protein
MFHGALREAGPPGFIGSAVCRSGPVPWLSVGAEVYADWYLLESSAALDPLNEAAVSGRRRRPHDDAARAAAGGAGGLYRLADGVAEIAHARWTAWFSKPEGQAYEELYAEARGWLRQPGSGLWRRQMVLGPAPEFCLAAPGRVELAARLGAFELEPKLVPMRG